MADLSPNDGASVESTDVPILDQNGRVVNIDPADVPHALSQGFTIPTAEQVQSHDDNIKFGGLGGQAQAFGLGVLRGSTLHASDLLLTRSGLVSPQTMSSLQNVNPISSLLGEGGGILGSSAFLPGGGAAGLVERAGAGAVDALVPAAAEGAGALARGASTLGSAVTRGTTEGAIYNGVGNSLTESALGDPNLNGEKIASNFLQGGLFGGVAGGVLGGLQVAVPPAIGAAKSALSDLYGKTVGVAGEDPGLIARGLSKLTPDPEAFLASLKNRSAVAADQVTTGADPAALDNLSREFAGNLTETIKKIEAATGKASADIRPVEMAKLTEDIPIAQTQPAADNALKQFSQIIDESKASPATFGPQRGVLEEAYGRLQTKLEAAENAGQVANALNEAKQEIGGLKNMWRNPASGAQPMAVSRARDLYSGLQKDLENPDFFGPAGARQSAYNDVISSNIASNKVIKSLFFNRTTGVVDPNKVSGYFKNMNSLKGDVMNEALSDLMTNSQKALDQVEQTYQAQPHANFDRESLDSLLQKHVEQLGQAPQAIEAVQAAKNAAKQAKAGTTPTGLIGSILSLQHPVLAAAAIGKKMLESPTSMMTGLAKIEQFVQKDGVKLVNGVKKVYSATPDIAGPATDLVMDKTPEAHEKFSNNLRQMIGNPQNLVDHVSGKTATLNTIAPQTGVHAQVAAMTAAKFLHDKLPAAGNPGTPFQPAQKPSKTEIATFNRYRQAVENPGILLAQAAKGIVSREALEAVQTVYPATMDKIRTEILKQASELKKGTIVPFATQQALSAILGHPLNSQLQPQSIQANQASFAGPTAESTRQTSGPKAGNAQGLASLTLGQRAETPTHAAATGRLGARRP